MRRIWWVFLVVSAIAGAGVLEAQTQAPPLIPRTQEQRDTRYQMQHRIVLNVLATDENGNPARGLKADDFTVFDDQQRQKISEFRANSASGDGAHAHVVVVLDAINSSASMLKSIRKGIGKFLSEGQGPLPYPISLVLINGAGNHLIGQSTDRNELLRALASLGNNFGRTDCNSPDPAQNVIIPAAIVGATRASRPVDSSGADGECLNRRFQESVDALGKLAQKEADTPGHALVIWTGPGWPLLVGPEFLPDTSTLRERDFAYLVELRRALREAQVTLDALLTFDEDRAAEMRRVNRDTFLADTPTADSASATSLALPALAQQSGGRVMENTADVAVALARSIDELDSFYMLCFNSAAASATDEYHRLEVKVNRPGVKIRTSTSYYDQP